RSNGMDMSRICQTCQQPIAPDTPMGLCPQCLVKSGFPSGVETATGSGARTAFVPPSVEELARLFPQLEILRLLGKGGMGAVYKARQKPLHRLVALKILPPGIGADSAFAERFTREAQALAQLNHPGIVTLYEFGQVQGMHFFLMEFVDGVNLGQALAKGGISPREALSIVPQICDALQFAHDQGIVHRDIKPENILLDRRGRVKVADFGLAILAGAGTEPAPGAGSLGGTTTLTETGKVVGTPRYMSPEQLERPGEVDRRADIYALGVVFYQMLTGELPGKNLEPPSRKVRLDVRLDAVVLRALAQKPELRFQQASELKTCVERIAGEPAAQAEANRARPPARASTHSSRRLFLGLAVAIPALVAGVVLALGWVAAHRAHSGALPPDVIAQTIQNEVGRQLREAGATYDDLQVTVALHRDSATPFQVSYRGLSHFQGADGTVPKASGSFVMAYIGAGQWQGALAETPFTVSVGSKDNINLAFIHDSQVLGEWQSVDFVEAITDFDPAKRRMRGELFLKGMTFLEKGQTSYPWYTWTKGILIHHGDQTASRYELRELQGQPYLFLEWKSGDFTILGKKPHYYVLRRVP
ncbi:MAG TPA: serine/threonine-protein kinase, partial [Bacillota bacterium]|nr:serine/threonine-protein kinase [Bacillota bacterium]